MRLRSALPFVVVASLAAVAVVAMPSSCEAPRGDQAAAGESGGASVPAPVAPPAPAPAATTRPPVPGVVVICVDTLRADDALGAAVVGGPGGASPAMPTLARLAAGATTFSDASASSSWTAPSVSTLLTGLLPSKHGVRSGCGEGGDLVASVTTLAERLKAAGWSTAAFTGGGWVAPEHGLAQGFDAFGATLDDTGPEALVATWARRRDPAKPFLLFLHTYAAHAPYGAAAKEAIRKGETSPEAQAVADDLARRFPNDDFDPPAATIRRVVGHFLTDGAARATYAKALGPVRAGVLWARCTRWMDEGFALEPDAVALGASLHDAYRDGLRHADGVLARCLASLERAGLPKDAALVVCGDHGEAFGEHGTLNHGRWLYDEYVRVPLVVRAPGRLPAKVVHGSCGLVDVVPTVLDLAGIAPPAGLDGRSLVALASGDEAGHPIVAEEVRRGDRDGLAATWRSLSVRTAAAKWLVTVDEASGEAREELFDLVADPAEARPLVARDLARFGEAFVAAVETARGTIHVRAPRPAPSPSSRPDFAVVRPGE